MTNKKRRNKLARALRRQGLKGARAFTIAKAIVKASGPGFIAPATMESLGIGWSGQPWCPVRRKIRQTFVVCNQTGACLTTAWLSV